MTHDPDHPSRRAFFGAATATVLASAAAERRAAAAADKDPVRVVVIGTGGRGSDLIRALTTIEGVEVVGVCDDYPPHLAQGAKYAGPKAETFADYRQALDRLRPQAVVIAVPLHLHFPIARDALDAGCAVVLRKDDVLPDRRGPPACPPGGRNRPGVPGGATAAGEPDLSASGGDGPLGRAGNDHRDQGAVASEQQLAPAGPRAQDRSRLGRSGTPAQLAALSVVVRRPDVGARQPPARRRELAAGHSPAAGHRQRRHRLLARRPRGLRQPLLRLRLRSALRRPERSPTGTASG